MVSMGIRLAHLSDSHIGYSAYDALSAAGNNQRESDILSAYRRAVKGIVEWDPDIVIHSGDVADTPRIDTRLLISIRNSFRALTDDGRRPLIVIAGNHDAPRSRKDVCFLELFAEMPNVHVVTAGYRAIDLGDIVVHAIPHDILKTANYDDVQPVKGRFNVLTTHGVADGSDLFLRARGREFAIPAEVMLRDWDYVALGHWHKRGPVALGANKRATSRIWYAGSTENISFRDLRDDNGMERGWLKVELDHIGAMPQVEEVNVSIRNMFRLPVLDGKDLKPVEIEDALIQRINAGNVEGAVVGQIIENVTRDTWLLCDRNKVRRAAHGALHYQITLRTVAAQAAEGDEDGSVLGAIDDVLVSIVNTTVAEEQREVVLRDAMRTLADAVGGAREEEDTV